MVSNLLKAPFMAIIYASLTQLSLALLGFLPMSDSYREAMQAFETPLSGYLIFIAYGFIASIIIVLIFSSLERVSIVDLIMVSLTLAGVQCIIPALDPIWFGDPSGIMSRKDLMIFTGARVLCTVLLVVLAKLVFVKKGKGKAESDNKDDTDAKSSKKSGKKDKSSYKLKIISVIIKILALSILFIVIYFPCWYFLGWNNAVIREFFGGSATEDAGFVAAVISRLLSDGTVLLYCMIAGLAYSLLTLPLMTRLPGKRLIFIISIFLLVLDSAALRLIPTPFIPEALRLKLMIRDAAMLVPYCTLTAFLLHLSYKKRAAGGDKDKKDSKDKKSSDDREDAKGGPTPKQQAEAVRITMNGNK